MVNKILGLTTEQVLLSREKNGDNSLAKEKRKSIFRRFFENLNDPIIKVLIFALVIEVVFTFGNCNLFEVFGILLAILIATTVSTLSEYGSERAFLKMQHDSADSTVLANRNGEIIEIPVSEIVVGDIIYLSSGEKIQADGVIISGSIRVDQSALNGESREVTKKPSKISGKWELADKGEVFRGSVIVSGEAVMRVGRVGASTYYGMVARDVQTETRESPLKLRLAKFASEISKIGYIMAAVVALTYLFNTIVADNGFIGDKILASLRDIKFLISTLTHALTLMITVVVVAAPEGLPMMITVVLSANMKKMLRDGVLVKKMVGIETAGSMNILFTDKTGTITTGKPECDRIISVDESYKTVSALRKNKSLYRYLVTSSRYNTDCSFSTSGVLGGNGTDRAIAEFFKDESCERYEIKEKTPFSTTRKYSAVELECGDVYIKGAPEIIISGCKYALDSSGNRVPMSRGEIESRYRAYAEGGSRVIGVAYRGKDDSGAVFLALIVLKDKLRTGVRDSVLGVKRAGVQVVMLTGDGKETASAIAKECGIMRGLDSEIVLTSDELSEMSDEQVKRILPNLAVLSRALPQDKTRLVRLSQELDLVVGMTGDGINDAPSLKIADVGFAMASGADIAKAAGDIVLLDNSFLSINRTILYGRTIFKSIRKFITFQLIMNLTACGVSLVGQFLGIDNPITIIQMLWVNIIMDTLGGLAFAGEAPREHYMRERPKRRSEPILSRSMMSQILLTGLYTLSICVAFLIMPGTHTHFRDGAGDIYFMTGFYALFIFCGIFNCFGARSERMWMLSGIEKNKPFVLIMVFISAVQILMIYFGGSIFRTAPLLMRELGYVIGVSASVVPFEFVRRLFYKLRKRK